MCPRCPYDLRTLSATSVLSAYFLRSLYTVSVLSPPLNIQWRFCGLHWGDSGVAIIAAGGTDLYCHSEPPLTSGKLCFIINFIGGLQGGIIFTGGRPPALSLVPPLNRPCEHLSDVLNVIRTLSATSVLSPPLSAAIRGKFGPIYPSATASVLPSCSLRTTSANFG